jgi:glucokinase
MATRYGVGIDVGGTKIYAGVVKLETGEVVGTARKRTHPERGVDFFTDRLLSVVAAAMDAAPLAQKGELVAMGIGIAGQVDRKRGIVLSGPNLAHDLQNLAVRDLLQQRFRLPVVLSNDVEVAALGEQQFGAGRGTDDFVCIFVGTGIGAAIVQGGKLRTGATGTAGEVGHTIVAYGGRICGCGGRGHLEAYASRTAITRVLLAELARGRSSTLRDAVKPDDTVIRSKVIAGCAEEGDELVLETLHEAADYLGAGLGSVATFYNPQRIVVGGGLVEAATIFLDRASRRAREVALPVAGRALEIKRAALGDNSGIVGAAWMASERSSTKDTQDTKDG